MEKILIDLYSYDDLMECDSTNTDSQQAINKFSTPKIAMQTLLSDLRSDTPHVIRVLFLNCVAFNRNKRFTFTDVTHDFLLKICLKY